MAFLPISWGLRLNKWLIRAFMAKSLHSWWKSKHLRDGNTGQFLDGDARETLLSPKNNGLLLDGSSGRLTDDASFRNLAMIATTGAGKTSSFIIPNLLTLDNCSIVATDPSGTLFERTSGDLKRRGYTVLKLDPTNLSESIGFNPLERANTYPAMQELAHILVKTASQGAKPDPFWTSGAEDILSILIKCLKHHPEARTYANLANLQYLLNNFGNGKPLIEFVAAFAPDEQTYQGFKGFISQETKIMQGMASQAKSALSILSDPDIGRLTAESSFDFTRLRREKIALFLTIPQNRISYYSLLASMWYTQLFHFCLDDSQYQANSLPIYFLLDEFGHLTIPDFGSIITTTRARRISLAFVIQSISQLEERYGKQGAKTILTGGVASQLYFPGMDIDTAIDLSKILGDVTHEHYSPLGGVRREKEALMTPSALRTMPDNQVLYLFANKRPVLLDVVPYYERREFVKRTKTPPVRVQGVQAGRVQFVGL